VSFWHDIWCGDRTLKEMFLAFFDIACNPEAMVADLLRCHNDSIHWDLTFNKYTQDWESDSLMELLNLLYVNLRLGDARQQWENRINGKKMIRTIEQTLEITT
jgi:hypothetical protein